MAKDMVRRATVAGGPARREAADPYTLSFNDIIGRTPGRRGRSNARKGMYEHRDGTVLVVFSVNPQFVELRANNDRVRGTRTGFTRVGMFAVGTDGRARNVVCDKSRDGGRDWKPYAGSIELAGNPHEVGRRPAEGGRGEAVHAEEAFDEDAE